MKKKTDVFSQIIERAAGSNARIVLPEGSDERIILAAEMAARIDLCELIVLGDKITLATKFSRKALKNITIIPIINPKQKHPNPIATHIPISSIVISPPRHSRIASLFQIFFKS